MIDLDVRNFVAKIAMEDVMNNRPMRSQEEIDQMIEEYKAKRDQAPKLTIVPDA